MMIDALISAGTKLLGGFLDRDTAEKNREAQLAMAERNIAYQREFAQQGLRWKVEDAKAAGIHPLYALGASGTSFSPVSIGSLPEGNMASTLGGMGQDISRAINATRTGKERADAFTLSAQKLDLEGKQLDNDIKRATLASSVQRLKQTANPPMPPTPGELKVGDPNDITQVYGGGPWHHDKSISDAQEFENRYGELSDWIMGPYILYRDYLENYRNRPESRINLWEKVRRMNLPRASFGERFGKWKQ